MFCEMKHLFKQIKHRNKVYGRECDVYLPEFRIGLELDGVYWHKGRYAHDKEKARYPKRKRCYITKYPRERVEKNIRFRCVFFIKETPFTVISRIVSRLLEVKILDKSQLESCRAYLNQGTLVNTKEYNELLYMLPSPMLEDSLQELYVNLATQWHPTKNGSLTPRDVTPRSNKKVWWLCKKGHEWEVTVNNRSQGSGCPYCSGHATNEKNCLSTVNPALASEWHLIRNGNLTQRYYYRK